MSQPPSLQNDGSARPSVSEARWTADSDRKRRERDPVTSFFLRLMEGGVPTSMPKPIQAAVRDLHRRLIGAKLRGRQAIGFGDARQLLQRAYEVKRASGDGVVAVRDYAEPYLSESQLAQVVAWCGKSQEARALDGRTVSRCFWKGVHATIWLRRERADGSELPGQRKTVEVTLANGADTVRKWLTPQRRWYEARGFLHRM